jgi:hypothetical protein
MLLDLCRRGNRRAAHIEAQRDGFVTVAADHDVLEVQDDVGDVLGNPGDGVELVQGVVEAHLGDRGTRDGRQECAA